MRFLPFAKGKKGYQFAGGGVSDGSGGSSYVLPVASSNTLGGVKVGDGLTIDSGGTLSSDVAIVPKFYTDETRVGTFNGKPVYAKTYTGRTSSSTVTISLPNISYFNVAKESSYATCDDGNYKVPFGFYNSSNFRYQAFYKGSTGNIEIDTVGSGFVGDYVLTVIYQKITD